MLFAAAAGPGASSQGYGSGSLPRTRAPSGLPPLRRDFSLSPHSRRFVPAAPALVRCQHEGRMVGPVAYICKYMHTKSRTLLNYHFMGSHIEMFLALRLAELKDVCYFPLS